MKHIMMLAALAALAVAGCNKPAGPQTASIEPPQRPLEQLAPEPAQPAQQDVEAAAVEQPQDAPPTQPIIPAAARTYTISRGDTFWSLAERHLGSGQRWPEIARANPGVDPNKLRIGQVINIPAK